MIKIMLDDLTVSTSKNLRGILRYNTNHTINKAIAKPLPDGRGSLYVEWSNGATCETTFESYAVLCFWLKTRRSWVGDRSIDGGTTWF